LHIASVWLSFQCLPFRMLQSSTLSIQSTLLSYIHREFPSFNSSSFRSSLSWVISAFIWYCRYWDKISNIFRHFWETNIQNFSFFKTLIILRFLKSAFKNVKTISLGLKRQISENLNYGLKIMDQKISWEDADAVFWVNIPNTQKLCFEVLSLREQPIELQWIIRSIMIPSRCRMHEHVSLLISGHFVHFWFGCVDNRLTPESIPMWEIWFLNWKNQAISRLMKIKLI